jgi:hypothetical protein
MPPFVRPMSRPRSPFYPQARSHPVCVQASRVDHDRLGRGGRGGHCNRAVPGAGRRRPALLPPFCRYTATGACCPAPLRFSAIWPAMGESSSTTIGCQPPRQRCCRLWRMVPSSPSRWLRFGVLPSRLCMLWPHRASFPNPACCCVPDRFGGLVPAGLHHRRGAGDRQLPLSLRVAANLQLDRRSGCGALASC